MKGSHNKKLLRNERNRINALPNSLLYNILSFLDMKEVMATSIISRRWRHLWESVSVLNFDQYMWNKEYKDEDNEVSSKRFMSFIDRVLLLRDGSEIKKLCIICADDDLDRLDTWLTLAARKHIQEVHLELCLTKESMELPNLIFISPITIFRIVVDVDSPMSLSVKIPSSISPSPELKTLVMVGVTLPEGNSNGELILSCPVLENLTLRDCLVAHLSAFTISTPQLKTLVIDGFSHESDALLRIKIWTPNLTSLEWNCTRKIELFPSNISKLHVAKIACYDEDSPGTLVKFLEAVSCATTIDITFRVFRGIYDQLISPFSNLRHLTICQCEDTLCTWTVLNLLKNAPRLETLMLDVTESIEEIIVAEDFGEEEIPFMISHLKSVEICGKFLDHLKVIEFLKILLKKAIMLEVLIIEVNKSYLLKAFGKQIHSLPKASSSITVIVV